MCLCVANPFERASKRTFTRFMAMRQLVELILLVRNSVMLTTLLCSSLAPDVRICMSRSKLKTEFSVNVFILHEPQWETNRAFTPIHLLFYTKESSLFKGVTCLMRTHALKSALIQLSALFAFVWVSEKMNCLSISIKNKSRGILSLCWMIGYDCNVF